MWQVIYIVPTQEEALDIEERLTNAGFLVSLEPMSEGGYQIRVPESEAEEVYMHLNENF